MPASAILQRFAIFSAVLGFAASATAADLEYHRDIRPIFAKHCFRCHSAAEEQAMLRLDSFEALTTGGDSGPAIVAGKASESLLLSRIAASEEGERMPPEGEALSPEEIEKVSRWIDAGAPLGEQAKHWAYSPPLKKTPPAIESSIDSSIETAVNPIDAFLAEAHAAHSLTPAPAASKEALLRRVTYDLVGLPPTRDELHAFLADDSPQAYERVVDRLLASPRYGERWGRHWMDVWRYSDWAGFGPEVRDSQPHIWRWRDWIVASLNEGKGYDEMIVEMLAGDELEAPSEESLAATGFLVRNWYKFNRNVWLDKTIEHVGKAFMGVTVGCARCHDHMYDPLKQDEYYSFRAFFEPYNVRTDALPGEPDTKKDGLVRAFDEKLDAPTIFFERGDERKPIADRTFAPATPAMLGSPPPVSPVVLAPTDYYPAMRPHIAEQLIADASAAVAASQAAVATAEQALATADSRLRKIESGEAVLPPVLLAENFSEARPEVWDLQNGQWSYENGRLLQKQTGSNQCDAITRQSFPADFAARLRVQIDGGQMWKSVGICFDRRDESNQRSVYISAVDGGAKVQVTQKIGGASSYPKQGSKTLPIAVGQEHTLEILVEGELLNVFVDGAFQFAYKMPGERIASPLAVWAFDAAAQFVEFTVTELDPARPPVNIGEKAPDAPPATIEAALAAVESAKKESEFARAKLNAAQAAELSLNARLAADRAKHLATGDRPVDALAREAAKAERDSDVAAAVVKVLETERTAASPEKEKQLADAKAVHEQAQQKAAETTNEYSSVGTTYPATSSGRRLALARWIASKEHPLTARVAINHIWQRHFQEPLAPTMFDFGANSQPPALPDLLDYLAVTLQESDWRMKPLHRLIVTSAAYRRDIQARSASEGSLEARRVSEGAPRENSALIDSDNRYFWRANPRRLEAEAIRDGLLAMSGDLDLSLGGPELDEASGQTTRRRSLYYRHAREKQMTMLMIFDAANPEECYRRPVSVAPQQALALSNSALALSQTRLLARAVSRDVGADPSNDDAYVQALYETVLARKPTMAEREKCLAFLAEQATLLANPSELTAYDTGADAHVKPGETPHGRARESLARVLCNHHEFVTIR